MRAADLLVLPSLAEGASATVLEAMFEGCPVVATDVGGTRELLAWDQAGREPLGWMVPPADSGAGRDGARGFAGSGPAGAPRSPGTDTRPALLYGRSDGLGHVVRLSGVAGRGRAAPLAAGRRKERVAARRRVEGTREDRPVSPELDRRRGHGHAGRAGRSPSLRERSDLVRHSAALCRGGARGLALAR